MSKLDNTLRELPFCSPVVLKNERCVYCGSWFHTVSYTKEHVIGRRFVPKGKLNRAWNLIVRACEICNKRKSVLENDISAITLFPDALGSYADSNDISAIEESRRKSANSISTRTGRPVKDSIPNIEIKAPFSDKSTLTVNLKANPELSDERVYELARLQCMAFFFFITYDPEHNVGGYWIGDFMPLIATVRSDWGNPVLRAFADEVVFWEPRIYTVTADGYFKVIIRKHPDEHCWSWALEWNKNYRVVGFIGNADVAKQIAIGFPLIDITTLFESPTKYVGFHMETPLNDEDDRLFEVNEKLFIRKITPC